MNKKEPEQLEFPFMSYMPKVKRSKKRSFENRVNNLEQASVSKAKNENKKNKKLK